MRFSEYQHATSRVE